jgi:hypothetical protein
VSHQQRRRSPSKVTIPCRVLSCKKFNLNSVRNRILSKAGRNARLRAQLSKLAKRILLSTGQRGFVWLDFDSFDSAVCECDSI